MARGRVDSDASRAARERLSQNPFYVLELRPECSRAEVERAGQKLLGMLELQLSAAQTYASPLGRHTRTPELVRAAMAELRDPNRRLLHELWATIDPAAMPGPTHADGEPEPDASVDLSPFPGLVALGFGDWRGSS